MQHVVDSRSGQHVGNRDYTPGFEYFTVASGGGADGGRQAGAAHSGHCDGTGWSFAAVGCAGRWHGPADAARLGYSLQHGWLGRARGPGPAWASASSCRGPAARSCETTLKTDGLVRWRCADLRDRIAAKFDVHLHERSVGKLLKKLNFSSMSGRPMHPQSDLEAQAAFKKTSPDWRAPQSRGSLPAGRSKSGFRMKPASASKAR